MKIIWARSIVLHSVEGCRYLLFVISDETTEVRRPVEELSLLDLTPPAGLRARIQFGRDAGEGKPVVFMYCGRKPKMLRRTDMVDVGYYRGHEAAEVAAAYARMLT